MIDVTWVDQAPIDMIVLADDIIFLNTCGKLVSNIISCCWTYSFFLLFCRTKWSSFLFDFKKRKVINLEMTKNDPNTDINHASQLIGHKIFNFKNIWRKIINSLLLELSCVINQKKGRPPRDLTKKGFITLLGSLMHAWESK